MISQGSCRKGCGKHKGNGIVARRTLGFNITEVGASLRRPDSGGGSGVGGGGAGGEATMEKPSCQGGGPCKCDVIPDDNDNLTCPQRKESNVFHE